MIDDVKQAIFAAENVLNWTPDKPGQLRHDAQELQRHYREAATQWNAETYPQTEAVTIAWITGKSAAEAALLWLQEINLAIESLKYHELESGKPLSEPEAHALLREAFSKWYEYDPSRMDIVSMRMQAMAKLTVESESITNNPPTDHVTLLQCAGIVNRQKRTLERWKTDDTTFPTPEVIGNEGRADEWLWSTIRPYLERKANRQLPKVFPSHVAK